MKPEITRSSWDDLIFEGRNKEYGAYVIRKSYDDNVAKGCLIAFLFVVFVFGVAQVASLLNNEVAIAVVKPKPWDLYYPPDNILTPVLKNLKLKAEPAVNKELLLKVVKQDVIEIPPQKIDEPTTTQNQTGTALGSDNVDFGPTSSDTPSIPVVTEQPKFIDIAEIMPQYEGGIKAMIKFLSKQLHYPGSERSIGHEGTVYVRFVVNSVGQVVDIEVIKGVSALLDREAMRVVALMTKWKPGMQNSLPVNVRMVVPIKFQLER